MLLIPGLLAVTLLGYVITLALRLRLWLPERLVLSYILGLGVFTFFWYLLNLKGVPFSLFSGSALLAGLTLALALFTFVFSNQFLQQHWLTLKTKVFKVKLNRVEKACIAVIVLLSLLAIFSSLYWPVKDWDSLVLYDFRAKTFVATGFMFDGIARGYFFGYPLLISLAHTWVYFLGYPQPGIIHSLFYVSFLVIFYSCLRQRIPRVWSLFWTACLALTPEMFGPANMTYTNLAYSVYLVSGFFYILRWVENSKWSFFWLATLLIGLSTWTRSSEPFWLLIPVVLIGVSWFKKSWSQVVIFPVLIYAFIYPWSKFERSYLAENKTHLENTGRYVYLLTHMSNLFSLWEVIKYFYIYVIKPSLALYVVLALLTYLMWVLRKKVRLSHWVLVTLIWGGVGLTFGGIYLFSLFYEDWRSIGGSASRMSIFFTPLIIYFMALVIHLVLSELGLLQGIISRSNKQK